MKRIAPALLLLLVFAARAHAQSPAGRWKKVSHTTVYEGKTMDTHAALLSVRPCAANIVYEIKDDQTYRLNAANSGCDAKYVDIQQRLWAKTKWKLDGNVIMLSATDFAVGHSYKVVFQGNRMVWTGTDGEGIITYQKL